MHRVVQNGHYADIAITVAATVSHISANPRPVGVTLVRLLPALFGSVLCACLSGIGGIQVEPSTYEQGAVAFILRMRGWLVVRYKYALFSS
jgi:uncharacterized membrane protein